MPKIILVTGGARSGKSNYAEKTAIASKKRVSYIATAVPIDRDMVDRISKHKNSRPAEWQTIEMYKNFINLETRPAFNTADLLLLDCITILITNLMMESDIDFDHCTLQQLEELEQGIISEIADLLVVTRRYCKDMIIVTNEVGLGLVPPYKMGNYFRDIAGRVNQQIANEADEVYFVVSGIPMKIK